jgi:hypothetical protein
MSSINDNSSWHVLQRLTPIAPLLGGKPQQMLCAACGDNFTADEPVYYVAEKPPVRGIPQPVCWRHVAVPEPE